MAVTIRMRMKSGLVTCPLIAGDEKNVSDYGGVIDVDDVIKMFEYVVSCSKQPMPRKKLGDNMERLALDSAILMEEGDTFRITPKGLFLLAELKVNTDVPLRDQVEDA